MASENKLRQVRVEAGVTIAELARKARVSDTTIRKIETRKISGKPETKRSILIGLSKITGVEYVYIEVFPWG